MASYFNLKEHEKMTVAVFKPQGGEQHLYMEDKAGSDEYRDWGEEEHSEEIRDSGEISQQGLSGQKVVSKQNCWSELDAFADMEANW